MATSLAGATVSACPEGAICDQPNVSTKTLVLKAGYWRPTIHSLPQLCPYNDSCAGGITQDASYQNSSNATCAPGRGLRGAFCTLCADPTFTFEPSSASCGPPTRSFVILCAVCGMGLLAACGWFVFRARLRSRSEGCGGHVQSDSTPLARIASDQCSARVARLSAAGEDGGQEVGRAAQDLHLLLPGSDPDGRRVPHARPAAVPRTAPGHQQPDRLCAASDQHVLLP